MIIYDKTINSVTDDIITDWYHPFGWTKLGKNLTINDIRFRLHDGIYYNVCEFTLMTEHATKERLGMIDFRGRIINMT